MVASKIEIVVENKSGNEIPSSDLSYAILEAQKQFSEMGYTSTATFSRVQTTRRISEDNEIS